MNIFGDLFQKIAIVITSIVITFTSVFTGQKPTPAPIPTTAEKSVESSSSASPTTKSPSGEKQVPKKIPSSSTTPSPSSQKTDSAIHDKIWELQNELQKKNQLKQQPTETNNLVSTSTPLPAATTLNIPSTDNSAPKNETIYSDYNFGYTYAYSPDEPQDPSSPYKYLKFTETSRDIRITRAIFRISDGDAEKHDLVDPNYFPTTLLFYNNSHYALERVDKNTFLYVGSRSGGLQMGHGQRIYLDISAPISKNNGGYATNISLPMSEWEIWDNTTGKLVKTQ